MNFIYNHCDLCGRFHKCEPGSAWKMVYSGYPPEPDHEATRCKACVDKYGPMEPQHGIRPECNTGIVRDTANASGQSPPASGGNLDRLVGGS